MTAWSDSGMTAVVGPRLDAQHSPGLFSLWEEYKETRRKLRKDLREQTRSSEISVRKTVDEPVGNGVRGRAK